MPIKSIFGRKDKSRDLCNWGRRKYVCCTYLIIFDQLIPIKPIFRGKEIRNQEPPRYVCFTSQIISDRLKVIKLIFEFQASAERSFTAVKYLKSYFWTTMTEERLNGFAVICTFILTFPLILI
ncbi:hypothetical protein T01_13008, partial [Trichinella spiralis]